MRAQFRLSSLIPPGLAAEQVCETAEAIVVTAHPLADGALCPRCGTSSFRVHSRYYRKISDLPCSGRRLVLHVSARRFFCVAKECHQKIFVERFGNDVVRPMARRTTRLDYLVHHLALALGGRPAARFADRLGLAVSNDTLLRTVRRYDRPPPTPPSVIGIDDWAWRRNHRYGTIICDLERRKTIALLPDREPATAKAWLVQQPQIEVVARDRGGGYALATAQALPQADQVADRWHLMENASHAFLDAVRKSMREVRIAIGTATINPKLLTAAERLQYEGYLRREEANAVIRGLVSEGVSIKEIVRRTGHSRKLVRSVVRGQRTDIFRIGKLPWNRISLGLRRNGTPDCGTALNFGGSFGWLASVAVSVLSPNGQRGEGVPKRPRMDWATRRRHALSSN
jgi:transposase